MTVENGNGELRQLLEVKRAYRADLAAFEAELKARYERELANAKKAFKERYLERIVDVVFAEAVPALVEPPEPEPKPEPANVEVPHLEVAPRCPECESVVDPEAKFCSHCAFPLKEDEKPESQAVVSTGDKFRARVSS